MQRSTFVDELGEGRGGQEFRASSALEVPPAGAPIFM
jgi:hypothetical protein